MKQETGKLIRELEGRRGRADLERLRKVLHQKGDPHRQIPCVHVAGTNGKGSTTNYIRSMMQEAGYRVGTFTSPSMEHHFDRIRINDEPLEEDFFLRAMREFDTWKQMGMTMFEIDFLIAAAYFYEKQVDLAVYEVGLGGEKDSTNVIAPLVCVITNIGKDHMELLGDTLEEIAAAKAGIIKRDTPLITAEDKPACLAVFAEACQKKQAPFTQIASISEPRITKEGVSFRYRQKRWQLGSRALYQCKNAACAIDVILTLREKGFLISEEQMEKGLRKAFWLGRYEILREEPLFLLDGAHNVDGIQALLHSLPKHLNLHIICSPLQDKETDQMLSLLKTLGEEVVVVHFDTPRAIHEEQIQSLPGVVWGGDYQEVIRQAWFGNAPTIVTGSLYFIADVRNYLKTLGVKMR
ncbi:bifunctional folylpolyglutamate synthase/dihydrofolate synthase [Massilicoli timonensis]|uniref:bifunctional folylpolyglutamate synthase/dihydrofolate synthase n=1 Tax=Massilicoli timonensis TaxID=2015901 RepID=UPI000C83B6B4|nr:folylpolyglutamate synthase/dihydrofolate synthase family protein [Massilicoli timonensis]